MKHQLKIKYYIRYADDFVVFSQDRHYLETLIPKFDHFLNEKLKLEIHPNKLFIKTISSGLDFLGWVHFTDHRTLRTTSKKRMLARVKVNQSQATVNSYLGLLKHGNTAKTKQKFNEIVEKYKKSK